MYGCFGLLGMVYTDGHGPVLLGSIRGVTRLVSLVRLDAYRTYSP